jgi:hypothetical protein
MMTMQQGPQLLEYMSKELDLFGIKEWKEGVGMRKMRNIET